MAIITSVPASAVTEFMRGTHQAGDIYKMALYTDKADLGPDTSAYGPAGEVVGTGYKAGGKELSGYELVTHGETTILNFDSVTWERADFTARGCVIYNASKGNKVIGVFDFGTERTASDGNFVCTIPKATADAGLIRGR